MDLTDNSADVFDLENVPVYLLKCFSCNYVFDEEERHPRLLSCLHCICFHCLQANSKTKGEIICSYCKEKYSLSNIRLSAFPRDNTKSGLLKLYQLKNSESTFKCQECEDELLAHFYCETCSKNLCDECHKYHKRAKKSHAVCSLQELPWSIDSVKKFCTRGKCGITGHQDQTLDFYCEKCDVCVCSKCVLTVHKDTSHQILESQNVLKRKITHLVTGKSMLDNKQNQIDKTIEIIERELSEIAVKSNDVSAEISMSFENAFQILKNRRQELLNELNVLTERKTGALKSQLSDLQRQKQEIESAYTFLHCSVTSADASAVLNIAPIISSRFTHLNGEVIDTVPKQKARFKYLDTGSRKTSSLMGIIKELSVYDPKTQVTIPEVVYEGEEEEICITLYDYDGKAVTNDDMEVSIVISKEKESCVDSLIHCSLRENGTYSCKFQIFSQGKYQVTISVLGCKIDAEPITIDVESVPVLASAQVPVCDGKKSVPTQNAVSKSFKDTDAELLMFFFNETLVDLGRRYKVERKTYPTTVTIFAPKDRQGALLKICQELTKYVESLHHDVITGYEEEKEIIDTVKSYRKYEDVFLIENVRQKTIHFYSKSKFMLADVIEEIKIKKRENRPSAHTCTSSYGGSRSFDNIDNIANEPDDNQHDGCSAVCLSKEIMKGKIKGTRVYEFEGKLQVHIYSGNILEVNVDALVSTENRIVAGSCGFAKALKDNAGKVYNREHAKLMEGHSHHPLNTVLMTRSGTLKFRNIFHVVVEQFSVSVVPTLYDRTQQWLAVQAVLRKANSIPPSNKEKKNGKHGAIESIAMSLFGSGKISTPLYFEIHCEEVYRAIEKFVSDNQKFGALKIKEVHFVNMRKEVTDSFNKVFERRSTEQQKPVTMPTNAEKYNQYHHKGEKDYQNQAYGSNRFIPEKYKKIDTWSMERQSLKGKIEMYMEPVPGGMESGKRKNLSESFTSGTGNFNIIDEHDKSKSVSVSAKTQMKLMESSDNIKKSCTFVHGSKCIACESEIDTSAALLDCRHHYCFVCAPVYKNVCVVCKGKPSGATNDAAAKDNDMTENCIICMDEMEDPVQLNQCKHQFCRGCITEYFMNKSVCPVCNTVYGALYGNQPWVGKATVYEDPPPLPGFFGYKTLIIDYEFPNGKQEENHPSPGSRYKGLHRQAYLPKTKDGEEVLRMLKLSFQQGLTFTIGTSRTTGEENVLTWNDIHHKTRREGGPERFGYPDESYITRVIDELEAKGIHSNIEKDWNNF